MSPIQKHYEEHKEDWINRSSITDRLLDFRLASMASSGQSHEGFYCERKNNQYRLTKADKDIVKDNLPAETDGIVKVAKSIEDELNAKAMAAAAEDEEEMSDIYGQFQVPVKKAEPKIEVPQSIQEFGPITYKDHVKAIVLKETNFHNVVNQIRTNVGIKIRSDKIRKYYNRIVVSTNENDIAKLEISRSSEKDKLPGITASMHVKDHKKDLKALRDEDFIHTGIISADFDNITSSFDTLFAKLSIDPYTYIIFRSPSGKIKALFRVEIANTVNEHEAAFGRVMRYCKEQFGEDLDSTGGNIGRICFLANDPNVVFKNAEALEWREDYKEKKDEIDRIESRTRLDHEKIASTNDLSYRFRSYKKSRAALLNYLDKYGIEIRDYSADGKYIYVYCIGSHEHPDLATAVWVDDREEPWSWHFNCFHHSCRELWNFGASDENDGTGTEHFNNYVKALGLPIMRFIKKINKQEPKSRPIMERRFLSEGKNYNRQSFFNKSKGVL